MPSASGISSVLVSSVKIHIKRMIDLLRVSHSRSVWTSVHSNIVHSSAASASSKLVLLAQRLQSPGPPIHFVLDQIALTTHRSAMMSFFCGDLFLARYAHNYFAKNLLPHGQRQLAIAHDVLPDASTLCMSCWLFRRCVAFEDEYHIMCCCPEYNNMRQELLHQLPQDYSLNTNRDMMRAMSGCTPAVTEAVACFLHRCRQRRRKLKLLFERYSHRLGTQSFIVRKAVWRFKGRYCCRHGVFFSQQPVRGCKCMSMSSSSSHDWRHAVHMPCLDHDLKAIVTTPFELSSYSRLTTLQVQARALGWY